MRISLRNLQKTYPDRRQALKSITFELESGLFGLLGPNGAGKTTLLSILAMLMEPSGGTVEYAGFDSIKDRMPLRARIGFLPQSFDLFPQATAPEILDYFGRLFGIERHTRKERLEFLLRQVGLTQYRNRKVKDYSVGMKKRLGVAQSLLNDPELLILDEPTSGLDPEERILFCNYLSEIAANRIIILSTHIVQDVEEICPRMGVLDSGQMIFVGAPWDYVRRAEGRTWQLRLSPEDAFKLNGRYTVVNRREEGNRVHLRLVGLEQPPEGGVAVTPTLEDAYVLHFQEAALAEKES